MTEDSDWKDTAARWHMEEEPHCTVNIRKSSSKDGGTGFEVTLDSLCRQDEGDRTVDMALAAVTRVRIGLGG